MIPNSGELPLPAYDSELSCTKLSYILHTRHYNYTQDESLPLLHYDSNLSRYTFQYSLESSQHDSHLHYVYLIGFPVFITIGVLANILDLWVLSQPSMKGVAFRYLARLALSDLLYLLFNIPFCLQDFALTSDGLFVSETSAFYYAYMAVPIVNYFLTLSVYIIVWLSYDRCLAVCSPRKFPAKQSLQVVHKRWIATIILTFLVYVPSPLRQTYECIRIRDTLLNDKVYCCVFESEYMNGNWFYIYEFCREIYSRFLPGILITAFNVAIIITLRMIKTNKNKKIKHAIERNHCRMNHTDENLTHSNVSSSKNRNDLAVKDMCSEFGELTVNCCHISTSRSVPAEKYELTKVSKSAGVTKGLERTGSTPEPSLVASEVEASRKVSIFIDRTSMSSIDNDSIQNSFRQSLRKRMKAKYIVGNETRNDREMCLVILLLAITIFFYISSFPSALYKIIPATNEADEEQPYDAFRVVADVLEISGHVFNFCLYFLLSPEFRKTLLSLLPFFSRNLSTTCNM